MKITERNQGRMVIKHHPLAGIIIGLFFVFFGGFMLFFPGHTKEITPWWLSVIFILSGLFAVFSGKFLIIVVADKNTGKISFFREGLINKQFEDFKISNIKEIKLKRRVEISPEGGSSGRFCAYAIMDDGQAVSLPDCNSSFYRKKEKVARELADFLEVPFRKDFNFSSHLILNTVKKFINKK